jgi:serine protease
MKASLRLIQTLFMLSIRCSAGTGANSNLPPGYDSNRYIITYRPYRSGAGKAAIAQAASRVHHNLDGIRSVAATVPAARVAALRRNPFIASIEPDPPRYSVGAADPYSLLRSASFLRGASESHRDLAETTPYGISMVQADQVTHVDANTKTICVMDSGYGLGHPDLPSTGVSGFSTNWNQDGCWHGTQ